MKKNQCSVLASFALALVILFGVSPAYADLDGIPGIVLPQANATSNWEFLHYPSPVGQGGDDNWTHMGLDIGIGTTWIAGDSVHAMADGVVQDLAINHDKYGNAVMIRHPDLGEQNGNGEIPDLYTIYMHLESAPTLQVDEAVTGGQIIGEIESTGASNAPHVHFEIRDFPEWIYPGINAGTDKPDNIYARGDIENDPTRASLISHWRDPDAFSLLHIHSIPWGTLIVMRAGESKSLTVKFTELRDAEVSYTITPSVGTITTPIPASPLAAGMTRDGEEISFDYQASPAGRFQIKPITITGQATVDGELAQKQLTINIWTY